jgi:hypothetical protein
MNAGRSDSRGPWHPSLGADLAYRLGGEDQLLLGGDSGLRGFRYATRRGTAVSS